MARDLKILITGAAGFIGSHLVDELLDQGVMVKHLRLLIPKGESLENLPKEKFNVIRGDIRNLKTVDKAVKGIDVIYHLAARIDFDGKTYADYFGTNVQGTQNLLDAAVKYRIRKFVFFSSIGVFGMPADVGPIVAWDESHPKTYSNFYGLSKYEGELRVKRVHERHGLPYAIVRPASVYGPREKGPTYGLFCAMKRGQFAMLGDGNNLMHYVYVKDLVKGTIQAGESKRLTGDYILAGPMPEKFSSVVDAVSKSIGGAARIRNIPIWIAYPAAHVLAIAGEVVGWKPPLFPSRIKTMLSSYSYSIAKAKREIGYDPKTSITRGMQETGKWYLENGKL